MITKHLDIGIISSWFTVLFLRYTEKTVFADSAPVTDSNFASIREVQRQEYSDISRDSALEKRLSWAT